MDRHGDRRWTDKGTEDGQAIGREDGQTIGREDGQTIGRED